MGFFTSDFGLGEEYANPKVSQMYQPSGGATSPALTSRQVASDPLSQLAQAMGGGGTSGGYNWNQQQQGKGLSGLSDLIGGSGLGGIGGGGTVMPSPSVFPKSPSFPQGTLPPSDSYVSGGGGDSSTQDYTGPRTLEEYLQSKEQTPSWLTTGARALIPGFSAMSSFADIGWGINPWYDTKVGGLFGAEPTFDWYKGDTNWMGRPASEKALEQQELRDLYTNFNFYKGSGMLPEGMDWGQFKASKGDIWGDKGMFGGVLDEAFAEQAAQQEGLNQTQISLMNQIANDMQNQYGDFTGNTTGQLEQMAAENASMFDSIEEYRAWQLNTDSQQQSWMENQFKDQAASQNDLNSTQIDLMNQIAMNMQGTYGEFSGQTGEQLANMAAENASMFDGLREYQDWLSSETPPNQEYVIEDPKTQNIFTDVTDTSAGGYTWDSDLGTVEEMQEETGLGTAEWDTSHEDFSWDDSGSSDSDDGGWGDSDAASDMDEDSGWSGADSDFDDSSSDSGGGDSGGGGGSYIATAATQALGEGGLTIFEEWRDYMFTALPTFTTSYGRYRVTAPKIVKAIDKKENSKDIYSWIWDIHLKPIFDMIVEDKDSEKALKDYKIMVKDLQNKFLKEKR